MKSQRVKGIRALFKRFLKNLNDVHYLAAGLVDSKGNEIIKAPPSGIKKKFHKSGALSSFGTDIKIPADFCNEKNVKKFYIHTNKLGYCECFVPVITEAQSCAFFSINPFFLKKPSVANLKSLAVKYGLNEKQFIEAALRIPVCSKSGLGKYIEVLRNYAKMTLELEDIRVRNKIVENENRNKDKNYRDLINLSTESIGVHVDGKFVYVNKATLKIFDAKSTKELIGKNVIDLVHPDYKEYVIGRLRRVKQLKVLPLDEVMLVSLKGREIRAEISTMMIDYNGKPAVQGVVRDVTAKRKAEKELLIRDIAMDSAISAISLTSPNGKLFYANKAFIKMWGYKNLSEVKEMHFSSFAEIGNRAREIYLNLLDGEPFTGEGRGKKKDGTTMDIQISANTVFSEDKKPLCVICSFVDISERKKSESALHESEERFRILSEITSDFAVSLKVKDGKSVEIEWATDSFRKVTGYKTGEIQQGKLPLPEDMKIVDSAYKQILQGKEVSFDFRILKKSGSVIWLNCLAKPVLDFRKKKVIRIFAGLKDITDKKIAEILIRRNEEKFQSLFENAPVGIFNSTPEGKILDLNPNFYSMLGYSSKEELIRKIDRLGLAKAVFANPKRGQMFIGRAVKEKGWQTYENDYIRKDGSVISCILSFRSFVNPITGISEIEGFITDITEIKRKEMSLRDSEARFRAVFENSSDAIGVSYNGYHVYVNDSFVKLFGFGSKEELISGNVLNQVAPECRETITDRIKKRAMGLPVENEYETKGLRKDGTIIDVDVRISNYTQEGKQFSVAIMRDVTEKKKDREFMINMINRYNLAAEAAKFAVWEWDIIEDKAEWNDRMFELYGIKRGRLTDAFKVWSNGIHPDDRAGVLSLVDSAFKGEKDFKTEFRIMRPDGSLKYTEAYGIIVRNENGEPLRMIGLNFDVTDKRLTEIALLEIERMSSTLIGNIPGIVYRCKNDENWTMEYLSKGCLELTGYNPEDFIDNCNLSYDDIIVDDDKKLVWDVIQKALSEKRNYELIYRIRTREGKIKWVWEKGSGVFREEGSLKALEGLIVDITERKQMEEALKIAKDKAEEMNKIKAAFFSTMSHELRTPMTGILGFADVLNNSLKDPEQKRMSGVILSAGERLMETLNMILDVTKIESDKLELKAGVHNLSVLVSETAELFRHAAEEKGLGFWLEIEPDVIALVDEKLCRQSMSNLIKNAVSYTREGSITVKLGKTGSGKFAELKIIDTGIGIPADKMDIIFEPFRQVSEGWGRKFEGTGLGLSITKKFIEVMGGEIKVDSDLNVGSIFTVILPAAT